MSGHRNRLDIRVGIEIDYEVDLKLAIEIDLISVMGSKVTWFCVGESKLN